MSCRGFGGGARFQVGHDEQNCEKQIEHGEVENESPDTFEREQPPDGDNAGEFLEDARKHHDPIPDGVGREDEEQDLPREGDSNETVEILGMGDGGRKVEPDLLFHEVVRGNDQDAVDAGETEHPLCELHEFISECR